MSLQHVFAAVDQQLALNALESDTIEPEPVPPSRVRAAQALTTEGWDAYWRVARGRGSEWLAPAYPNVDERTAAQITLGRSPVEVVRQRDPEANFTKAEAHEWLRAGADNTVDWWMGRHLPAGVPRLRSWNVLRWLKNVKDRGAWNALLKERPVHGPGGQELTFRYMDKIDEIQDDDILRGPKTSVDDVFAHAAERVGAAWQEKMLKDNRVLNTLPKGWKLPEYVRMLDTPAKLAREGKEMAHCVGGYAGAVEKGQSVILGVDVPDKCRSTVELTRKGKILQHKGPRNASPLEPCASIIDALAEELLLKATPARANPHTTLRMAAGLDPPASEYCIDVIEGRFPPRAQGEAGQSYGWGNYRRSTRRVTVGRDWLREQAAGAPGAMRSAALYVLAHEEEKVPGQCRPGYGRTSIEDMRSKMLRNQDLITRGAPGSLLVRTAAGHNAVSDMRERANEVLATLVAEGLLEQSRDVKAETPYYGASQTIKPGAPGAGQDVYFLAMSDDKLRERLLDSYQLNDGSGVTEKSLINSAVGPSDSRRQRARDALVALVAEGKLKQGVDDKGEPIYWAMASDEQLRDRALGHYAIARGVSEEDLIDHVHASPTQRGRVLGIIAALVAEGELDRVQTGEGVRYRRSVSGEALRQRVLGHWQLRYGSGAAEGNLVNVVTGYLPDPDLRRRVIDVLAVMVDEGVLEVNNGRYLLAREATD